VPGALLASLALATALATGAEFMRRMRAVAIPRNRIAFDLAWGAALALGVAAFVQGVGIAAGLAAGLACALGGLMLLLRLQSAQAANLPRVAVGGPILDFRAPDEDGRPFSLASLSGRPFLLKFFRGHW
jgi:cytochrome oxidase Cu insertion factor (SCO1/SenC/PrrC family)